MVNVTWYEALQYCRWISEKEEIPNDQMCYPVLDDIKEGMRLAPDFLARTGYRLPTEPEWEYACRAGTLTSRAFGASEEMLEKYAWFVRNSQLHAWPVGQLKPNDFGLFDMHGNVGEWCQNDAKPAGPGLKGQFRPYRGGTFLQLDRVRSAAAAEYVWMARANYIGFRVARTVH
jgi:formylglycine-generating enzyme required for sulfatase activity